MNTWRDLGPLFIGDGEYLILSYLAKIRETFEFESRFRISRGPVLGLLRERGGSDPRCRVRAQPWVRDPRAGSVTQI